MPSQRRKRREQLRHARALENARRRKALREFIGDTLVMRIVCHNVRRGALELAIRRKVDEPRILSLVRAAFRQHVCTNRKKQREAEGLARPSHRLARVAILVHVEKRASYRQQRAA